jgi:hypothetical protein
MGARMHACVSPCLIPVWISASSVARLFVASQRMLIPLFLQGSSIAVPGFHLHFISSDRKRGGHVLDCVLTAGSILMHPLFRTEADMPHSLDFLQADLSHDPKEDIEEAERGS